ncbi:MAG: efflux RND transporter permease subunit [Bacteroidetes bacterium]|nr:efflux RND transporter permease subunit [Bacteroidota bacterium]
MTLSEFTLNNKYMVYAATIAAIVFGLLAYLTLPIQLFPETAPPLVNILTAYPGAAATDVADLVSDPIEEECAALEGVYKVKSTSQDGLSLVSVEFNYDISVDLAAVDVQNAIARIRGKLPREAGEAQVLKFSTSDRPILTVGLRGDDMVGVRRLAEEVFSPELQRLPGVAMVDVFGGSRPEIIVDVDRASIDAHRLSLPQIVSAIRGYNVSVPAGQITQSGQQYTFRMDEQRADMRALGEIPVQTAGGSRLRVRDVATIRDGASEDQARFRVNGQAAIAVQIFKQDGANTVAVVERAQQRIAEIGARYAHLEIIEAEESASFTRQVVDNMLGSVWQALLLATIIIFLFLGSVRRGIVVAISMPMAFLLTFAGMKLLNIEVNMVTLTAIILAVGMVVDASVVVLENITRRQEEEGLTPVQAAIAGANEIQFAVLAGNVTTITVLLPLLFLYGFVGKTFGPLASTLILAFLSSLLVALGFVPLLTTLLSGKAGRMERLAARITAPWNYLMELVRRAYIWLLDVALRWRWAVVATSVALFVAGLLLLRGQGMEMLPKMDGGSSFVTVETPSGSSLEETERVMKDVERILLDEEEVVRISNQMGFEPGMRSFGGGGVQGPAQGYISVTFTPRTERNASIWEIQERLRDKLLQVPTIRNLVLRESGSTAKSTTASSIVVSIKGEDPLILDRLGDEVLENVSMVSGVVNPWRSWRMDQQSIALHVHADRAHELGLTPAEVAQQLVRSLDGMSAGMFREETGEHTPIRVRYAEPFRREMRDVFDVRTMAAGDGRAIPLGSILESRELHVQGLVTRENLESTLDVLALHEHRPLNFIAADVRHAIEQLDVPRGYSIALEGEDKDMGESRNELLGALGIAFVAVYLLLVAQFRSFLHPVTVLMSVPLSLIGVSLALWLAGMPVSMPVMIGLILLVGIVVNNSIILIDFIRRRREEGIPRRDAIIDSVRTRFRPIMMTSLSTMVGMLPLALEWALGAERFSPLAVAVIGGMAASTLLTMVVIPVLYDIFDGFGLRGKLQRKEKMAT